MLKGFLLQEICQIQKYSSVAISLLTTTSMRFVREISLHHSLLLIAEDADCIVNYQSNPSVVQKDISIHSLNKSSEKDTRIRCCVHLRKSEFLLKYNSIVNPTRVA